MGGDRDRAVAVAGTGTVSGAGAGAAAEVGAEADTGGCSPSGCHATCHMLHAVMTSL